MDEPYARIVKPSRVSSVAALTLTNQQDNRGAVIDYPQGPPPNHALGPAWSFAYTSDTTGLTFRGAREVQWSLMKLGMVVPSVGYPSINITRMSLQNGLLEVICSK